MGSPWWKYPRFNFARACHKCIAPLRLGDISPTAALNRVSGRSQKLPARKYPLPASALEVISQTAARIWTARGGVGTQEKIHKAGVRGYLNVHQVDKPVVHEKPRLTQVSACTMRERLAEFMNHGLCRFIHRDWLPPNVRRRGDH
jgi:hypothetical protein